MFSSRTNIIAIVTITSLLAACGGDDESSGTKLKSVGPNQTKVFKSDGSTQ